MNNLMILILEIFRGFLNTVAVISNNTEYTGEYIINSAKNLVDDINDLYPRRIKIALVANNSVEWIIIFIGVLLSKHQLLLFSPNLTRTKLYRVLQSSRTSILITDIDLSKIDPDKLTTCYEVISISNIKFNSDYNKEELSNNRFLYRDEDCTEDLIVYTPRQLKSVKISYNQIVSTLGLIEYKKIFDKCTNYVVYQEFTYNYIMCLLSPLLSGVPIIIPNKPKEITAYFLKYSLLQQKTEVIILTAYQFEMLWREYIENKTDIFTEFLEDFKFKRLRRWRIKRHLKQLFPNLKLLIIFNSTISTQIQLLLKKIKFPFTVTYGTIESGGVGTYSNPSEFKVGSCGKRLSIPTLINDQNYRESEDEYVIDDDNVLWFNSKSSEVLHTENGMIISRDVENILKNLPLITDCIFIMYEDELILLVQLDWNYCDYNHMNMEDIQHELNNYKDQINQGIDNFEKIDKIRVDIHTDFKRDSYGRILKEYYIK